MPKAVRVLGLSCLGLLAYLFIASPVHARSFSYPRYDVDITINSDSTVDVRETATYKFDGEFRGVVRQITLDDQERNRICASSGLTCGGFERIALTGVLDEDGRQLDPSEYDLGIVSDEDAGTSYYEIRWEVWPGGQVHAGTEFTWTIEYTVYGSLGWLGQDSDNPQFYWNALPSNRGGKVNESLITINFPNGIRPDIDNFELFTEAYTQYEYQTAANSIQIRLRDLVDYTNATVAYDLPRGGIQFPAVLKYSSWLPLTGVGLIIDGVNLGDIGGLLQNMPPGKHTLEFYRDGYSSYTAEVDLDSGEELHLNVDLQPGPGAVLAIVVSVLLNFMGLILIPVGLLWVYLRWQNKGRDQNAAKSIYPQYHPPEGVQPYLLGSLKDEKVDREDVTGTTIDLAYRGYIKIKELKKDKNYELTRLDGKKGDVGLNEFEEQLLDDLFGSKDSVETEDVGAKFAMKYQKLVKKAYKEMVTRGYFTESPETTRAKHLGCGIALLFAGGLVGFGLGMAWFPLAGIPGPFLLGLAAVFVGVAQLITSQYMPAKTPLGSKVLAHILGFKMYLHHAERYRLQGLTPDEFERYLSYAIVFGIEKEWAKKFEDIYKGQPDWYESSRSDIVWDAYWMSRFSRSFANTMQSTVYQSLPKGGSGAGSGWSGGGSFGGFSGGGGGGGSSGAF